MSKYVIDMDDYEPPQYEEYDGEDPRPGWYNFELQDVQVYDADTGKLQWIFVIADEPFKGWPGMMFGDNGNTKWVNQQVNKAIQGGLEKPLSFDPEDDKSVDALVKKAKRVKGKVEKRTYNEETRLVLRKVRPILEDASKGTTRRAPAEKLTKAEPVAEAAPDTEGASDEPYTEDELAQMSLEDLKEILKEELGQDVPAKGRREKQEDYENKIIDLILAAQEAEEGGDADGENTDDFGEGDAAFEEPVVEEAPEPAPATRRRRGAAAAPAAAPAKAAPAKAAATTRRRRG